MLLKNISNDAQLCQSNNHLTQYSDSENDKSRCYLERSCESGHFSQIFPLILPEDLELLY